MPKILNLIGAAVVAAGAFTGANASAANVTVDFSPNIASNMGSINEIEQRHEEFFREYYDSYQSNTVNSARKFNAARLQNVNWAGRALIPNIGDYTLENLTVALVSESLARAGMGDLDGTIRVTFERIKIADYSLSALRGTDTFVIGTIEHLDSAGAVIDSTKLSTNLVYGQSVDVHYQGPDFAFYTGDATIRVGPAVSRFIEKGLETLFAGTDFSGPILIGQ